MEETRDEGGRERGMEIFFSHSLFAKPNGVCVVARQGHSMKVVLAELLRPLCQSNDQDAAAVTGVRTTG